MNVAAKSRNRLVLAGRALRFRNFRLYLGGQAVSLIGTWMTRLALSWLTYRLTHSEFLLGLVGFMGQIFSFVLAPFAGVWLDQMDRRKVLVVTQALASVQSLVLAWLTLSGIITINEILVLAGVQGLVDGFAMPARQSFVVKMVDDRADLSNAIALNSSAVNLARLVGPALAAFVIARLNEGWCFLIDGVSYFAVIASLLAMRVVHTPPSHTHRPTMLTQMKEGWGYVSTYIPIRNLLLLFCFCSLTGMPYTVLLPVFATQVLHGNAHTLGLLTASAGTGALISALSLAARKNVLGLVRMVQIASVCFGAGLIVFGLSNWLWLSVPAMLLTGFGMIQGMSASNTVIQTLTPDDKRGRVMSYYTLSNVGMMPFGSLIIGAVARWIGAPRTVMAMGVCVLLAGLVFFSQSTAVKRAMRPRYEELGILKPKVAPDTLVEDSR